jgi:hypothetical protein
MRVLAGMSNFFGKKGLGTTILRGAQRLNPIDLSRGSAARAWQHIMANDVKHVNLHYDDARRVFRGTAPKWSGTDKLMQAAKGYWAGDNLSDMARNMGMGGLHATPAAARRQNMLARRAVLGAMGAYAGGNLLLGRDNSISNTAGAGLSVGLHGTIMGALGTRNPAAGMAYGAWAGLNALRPGNNFGPF